MSILTYRPQELIENRKAVSDALNNTDELSFTNSKKKSSHGEAAAAVRNKASIMNIQKLCTQTDTDYFEELFKEI